MNKFKSFNIKPPELHFIGDKIKIDRILNTEIMVHDYKIGDSVKKQGTKYLTLQIEKQGNKHVVFSGSTILMKMIEQVARTDFPFSTTIIKHNEYLEFT